MHGKGIALALTRRTCQRAEVSSVLRSECPLPSTCMAGVSSQSGLASHVPHSAFGRAGVFGFDENPLYPFFSFLGSCFFYHVLSKNSSPNPRSFPD